MRYLLPLLLLGTPVFAANYTCILTTECVDVESCESTDFSVAFAVGADNFPAAQSELEPPHIIPVEVTTDAMTLSAQPIFASDAGVRGFWTSGDNGEQHLMTVSAEGTARYTVHMPSYDTAVFYTGTCEEE